MAKHYIILATLCLNTAIAVLVFLSIGGSFVHALAISHSIGISVLFANLLMDENNFISKPIQLIGYNIIGLAVGILTSVLLNHFLFKTPLKIGFTLYIALIFTTLAVLVAWLFFSKSETHKTLALIKRKMQQTKPESKYLNWITATHAKDIMLINVDSVFYFQAQQKYTAVFSKDSEYLINTTIKTLSKKLNPDVFWQISRATIVNLHHIEKISKDEQNKLSIHLKTNQQPILSISRHYAPLFKKM